MTEPLTPPGDGSGRRTIPPGRLTLGVILILIGVGALVEAADWADVPWETLLPVALIVVGGAMLLAAGQGRARGLFVTGTILSVLLAIGATFDVTVSGGVGDRLIVVTTSEQLQDRYELGVGDMQLDLSDLALPPGLTEVEAHVGIGKLTVLLPEGTEVFIDARASVGEVTLPDGSDEGVDARRTYRTPGYDTSETALLLDLSVSLGSIEVAA